jgi:hypothetical protein
VCSFNATFRLSFRATNFRPFLPTKLASHQSAHEFPDFAAFGSTFSYPDKITLKFTV